MAGEEKAQFISFVQRMLRWLPEERSTAREMLDDPWLHEDFSQDQYSVYIAELNTLTSPC